MSELFKKELRALLPMALLIVAVFAALFFYGLINSFPDIPDATSADSEAIAMLVLISLFATMTGASLLTSESGDGTLRFLDSLPVSRSRIFWAKIFAGIVVLHLSLVLAAGLDLFSFVAEHQSTSDPANWQEFASDLARESVTAIYILSVAAMLSFAGRWFILVTGFVFWGFLWLRVNKVAWSALFDPHELMTYNGSGKNFHFPWHHAVAALSASAVALGIAWLGFYALGDRVQHAVDRTGRWRFAGILRVIGFALIPVAWIGAIRVLGKNADPGPVEKTGSSTGGESAFGSRQTERYDFVFRESQREKAAKLIAAADEIHDKVTSFLEAPPMAGRIVVDLGSPVIVHVAGQTNWTKIRVPLGLGLSQHELEVVLGHETTHVYIEQLSNGAMARHFDNARFFHEGLATYVEHRLFSTPEESEEMTRLAAVSSARGKVPFETLVSNDELSKTRDGLLVYPLGEVFCRALVSTHGDKAPGRLLRAFARAGAPVNLSGVALWRDAMQSCDYSLDRVTAAYDAEQDRLIAQEADFIAKFPLLTAKVAVEGSEIVLHPQFEGVAPGKIVCMLQPVFEITLLRAGGDGAIRLPRSQNPGPKLRYLLGWESADLRWPLFETWTEAPL